MPIAASNENEYLEKMKLRFGDFSFDLESGELVYDGKPVRITERERDLLRVLATKPGGMVPRQALVAPDTE